MTAASHISIINPQRLCGRVISPCLVRRNESAWDTSGPSRDRRSTVASGHRVAQGPL